MTVEITDATVGAFHVVLPRHAIHQDYVNDVRDALAAVIALPEVRQAVYDNVRRENEQKLRDMGVTSYNVGWDQ